MSRQQPSRSLGSGAASSRRSTQARRHRVAAWCQQHQDVAVDSLYRLLQDRISTLMTWMVIGVALALPLCLAVLVSHLQQLGGGIDAGTEISVYMDPSLGEDELGLLRERVAERPEVASLRYISAAEALRDFEAQAGFADALTGLEDNPLPPVLVLSPAISDTGRLDALLQDLQRLPGVDSAQLDLLWVQRLQAMLSLGRRITLGLAGLLCLGVLLVIGNTIRLAIENRRAEIVVVKLVGASDAWVARPFLYTGFWYGAGGGLVAAFILGLALWLLAGPVSRLAGLYSSSFVLDGLNISATLLVLLGSGLLGWLGALIAVLRHLRAIEPR